MALYSASRSLLAVLPVRYQRLRGCRYYTTEHEDISDTDPIHRLDLRVGRIVAVENHTTAPHLYVEQIDLNIEPTPTLPNPRTVVSGLATYMTKESLMDKHVVVVGNIKPSAFRGIKSYGLLLAACKETAVEILEAPKNSVVGERVHLLNMHMGEADLVLKPKQRIYEQVVQGLETNAECEATYKGHVLVTSAGPITCKSIENGKIS
ncbi:hypothetical protein BDF14DRAFT_1884571 [Spinellus fusiger]|nr:hypothetical protein BDF14DRAFT_1884571 [Spinellus fusiger]